jgi:hypothetical protein
MHGPPGPPYGTSTTCGDAIVGTSEECDDGDEGPDACTLQCQTRDQVAVPAVANLSTDRYLGTGRHPVSGLADGFITTYVEQAGQEEPHVGATLFNIWGQPGPRVKASEGASPIDDANPVAAALPGGKYAVAWSDFDGDGSDLGVALRIVEADGSLGPLQVANAGAEFSQLNPDMLWTGSQLVVAWEDYADAVTGPDLRYRLFDADLTPISDDRVLADDVLPEGAVALAPFNGGWAAAYREGTVDGKENVVVWTASTTFRVVGSVLGGPADDRPALLALDATHLLVVVSAGTDPGAIGTYNTPRLRYSVIDTASVTPPTWRSLDPRDDIFSYDDSVSQLSPSAVRGPDGAYLAWRSEARAGDAAGDQIWLKYLGWDTSLETPLDVREPEKLIPRLCEGSIGDQRRPALARVALPPHDALAIAWDDYSHSQGANAGDPDVVVHYGPIHPRSTAMPSVVTEDFTGTSGGAWPAQWHSVSAAATPPVTLQANEGRVAWASGAGTVINYIADHNALDVEMFTKVRFNLNGATAGFVARMIDAPQPSYLAGRVGTLINDTWQLWAVVDGNPISIAKGPVLGVGSPAAMFTLWAQGLDFFMRFRVTNVDQGIQVAIKLWLSDLPEPAEWTVQGTTSNATIVNKLGNAAGRFGLLAYEAQSGRTSTFDDFRATFYEGPIHGDPSAAPPAGVLMRGEALYRACTADAPCTTGEACCTDATECGTGLTCSRSLSQFLGLGSHAQTCAPSHCTNRTIDLDQGEVRVDCGGPDCAPCTCTTTNPRGGAGYAVAACPGGIGDADCGTNADCLPGLICRQDVGYKYGWPLGVDVCSPEHCWDRMKDADEIGIDWGGSCGNVQCPGTSWCTVSCPCTAGTGDCDYNDECVAGLICSTKGANFGVSYNVCVAPHCTDKVLNGGETKVDCGGPDCGSICP